LKLFYLGRPSLRSRDKYVASLDFLKTEFLTKIFNFSSSNLWIRIHKTTNLPNGKLSGQIIVAWPGIVTEDYRIQDKNTERRFNISTSTHVKQQQGKKKIRT
jgi:hypothetical protein